MYNSVMVIDDNSIDRYVAEVSMVKNSFAQEVISKESAITALDYLKAQAASSRALPELIFLDINMPEVNGFEFLEHFAQLPPQVHMSCDIIMLSSSLDPADHQKVEESKFVSRFINKPLKKDKLKEILSTQSCCL